MGTTKTTTKGKGNTTPTPTTPTPVVTFVPPTPVTPKVTTGNSTTKHPVGVTWVTCLNLTHHNGGNLPTRKVLHKQVMGVGVTYNTTRTQVQHFTQWFKGTGKYHPTPCNPNLLPKGVTLPSGLVLNPPTPTQG